MRRRSRGIAEIAQATEALPPAFFPVPNIYQRILDTLEVGIAHVTTSGYLLYANRSFLGILGITERIKRGKTSLKDVVSASSWTDIDEALRLALRCPVEGEMKIDIEGHARLLRLTFTPLHVAEMPTIRIVAVEMTELMEANKALEVSKKSLQALSARILRLQDDERRHIARDLHDITGQELAVISMSLAHLANSVGRPGVDVRKAIADATALVRKVEDEVRTLSYVLHPPLLDELGLSCALDWYIEGFSNRTGICVALEAPSEIPRFSGDKEIGLFRVVQESLTNVLRHSGSKSASVALSLGQGFVQVSVSDQGKGIPGRILHNINAGRGRLGVGLPGMRERIKQLDGMMEIISGKQGTSIIAMVPLQDEAILPALPSVATAEPKRSRKAAEVEKVSRGPKRIVIADDHEVARIGLKTLLANEGDLEVVAEAADGVEAVKQVAKHKPDLLIVDLIMPHMGGFAVMHRLHEMAVECKFLVFTTHYYPQLEQALRAVDVDGFVLKSNVITDLMRAVHAVLGGEKFFPADEKPGGSVPRSRAASQ